MLHLLLVLASTVFAAGAPLATDCGTTNYTVVDTFTKNFTLAAGLDCHYKFTWGPKSAFIASHAEGIYMFDNHGTAVKLSTDNQHVYTCYYGSGNEATGDCDNFYPPGTTVKLRITSGSKEVYVTMSILVSNVTKDAVVMAGGQVVTGVQPIVITDEWEYGKTYVYTSNSQIVLSAASPYYDTDEINSEFFDGVFVYDGQGANATFIGSLGFLEGGASHPLNSTSISFFVTAKSSITAGKVIISNKQNVGFYGASNVFNQFPYDGENKGEGVSILLGSGGTVSIVNFNATYDNPVNTNMFFTDDTAVIQLYSGLVTNKMAANYIKQFTSTTWSTQSLQGTAFTFILNRGYCTITVNGAMNLKNIG